MSTLFQNNVTPLNEENLNKLVAVEQQSFTETQKQQARTNIGAETAFTQLPLSKFPTSATANRILKVSTANSTPAYSQVALTTDVTGTLPIANGGTGVSTVAGQSATQVKVFASPRSTTAGAPSFQTLTAADVGAQATLISGSNIKTINSNSLLGSGNINITAADVGAQATLVSGSNIKTINGNTLLGSGNILISGSGGGQGLPAGGMTGQVLSKIDSSDYNVQWSDPSYNGAGQQKYIHNIRIRFSFNGNIYWVYFTYFSAIASTQIGSIGELNYLVGLEYGCELRLPVSGSIRIGEDFVFSNILLIPGTLIFVIEGFHPAYGYEFGLDSGGPLQYMHLEDMVM